MSTGIQWTDETWNPVVGCEKVSQGCKNCYAKAIHDMRHKAYLAGKKVAPQYAHPFEEIQLKPERLHYPLSWQKPSRVFVNSVSDLFHEDVPVWFIDKVFAVMCLAQRHTFQILTKRPERMRAYLADQERCKLAWGFMACAVYHRQHPKLSAAEVTRRVKGMPPGEYPLRNVHLGVSVERQKEADERIPILRDTWAWVRFLSCEPLLGPLDLREELNRTKFSHDTGTAAMYRSVINWVIVGGESGKGARPCDVAWIRDILAQCRAADVPCFVKQLGAEPGVSQADADEAGGVFFHHYDERSKLFIKKLKNSHGGDPDEWPDDLRVREFPMAAA